MHQDEERPITLILDCPITGRTVMTHMREDQLDMFIDSCVREIKSDIDELVKESEPCPVSETFSEEDYFYD